MNFLLTALTLRYLSTWFWIKSSVVETSVRFEKNDSFLMAEF